MTLLIRESARVQNARSFYRDIYNENDFFYLFASRAQSWDDDTTPETPRDSQFYQAGYRNDMLFVKRIQAADAVQLAPRYDWTTGTVYDQYDDEYADNHPAYSGATNLADARFFVITDDFNVYKCLNNGGNAQSTQKPNSTGTEAFELSDGYTWKFMFQVSSADRTKFLTTSYIPVRKVAGAGNPAFDVNGEIDSIAVDTTTGIVASVSNIGAADSNRVAGTYSDVVSTSGGGGVGAKFTITIDGVGAATVDTITTGGSGYTAGDTITVANSLLGSGAGAADLTFDVATVTTASGGSGYTSVPTVVIQGDGTGATATATVSGGVVTGIDITAEGRGYSFALIQISGGGGSGATATATLGSTETPTLQQAVEATAVSGTIDRIVVTNGGLDYIEGDAVVNIEGDGTGAVASATINSAGTITAVNVTSPGSGYTFATITITQTVGLGTGVSLRPIISPYEGHGGNPPRELFAKNVGCTVSFISDDADMIIGNEYRQIGLIKNIHDYDENDLYTASIGTPCHVVTTSEPGQFNLDDILVSDTSGKFRVIQKLDVDGDGTTETIYLQEILDGISSASIFENTTTGITGITINSETEPEVSNHSGEILYIDNRRPITRDENQIETIKVIFNF